MSGSNKGEKKEKIITAKKAALKATEYYQELTNDSVRLTLEEVELSDDRSHWLITLGYPDQGGALQLYGEAMSYKLFTIDAVSGEVLSMKIRKI